MAFDRVVRDLNLDTTDMFTKLLASAFAFQDALDETRGALARCQDEIHQLRAMQSAAREVVSFDWSGDNDDDAVEAIDLLRKLVEGRRSL